MVNKPSIYDFEAIILKAGINPYIDIPEAVSYAFGIRGNIPVKGKLDGIIIRGTLVPAGKGRHRLYINTEMRKKALLNVGDAVHLSLELENEPRVMPIPLPLSQALENNEKLKKRFESLLPSRRKEILAYLNSLKTPESLDRNIKKVVQSLLAQEKQEHGEDNGIQPGPGISNRPLD